MTTREFLLTLRAGDVLLVNSKLRVLRSVHWVHHPPHKHWPPRGSFTFAIRRCSWTGKGYTVYNTSDMMRMDVCLVGRNFKSNDPLSQQLDKDIASNAAFGDRVRCWDVVGRII